MIKTIAAPSGQECSHVIMSQDEVIKIQSEIQEINSAKPRMDIIEQILILERQQNARRIREAALGIDGGFLSELNSKIENLRIKL